MCIKFSTLIVMAFSYSSGASRLFASKQSWPVLPDRPYIIIRYLPQQPKWSAAGNLQRKQQGIPTTFVLHSLIASFLASAALLPWRQLCLCEDGLFFSYYIICTFVTISSTWGTFLDFSTGRKIHLFSWAQPVVCIPVHCQVLSSFYKPYLSLLALLGTETQMSSQSSSVSSLFFLFTAS